VDPAGNLFILDTFNYRVRKVAPSGIITTLATVVAGWALAVDDESNIVVTYPGVGPYPGGIVKISADGTAETIPGAGGWGAAVDSHGNLFTTDGSASVQRISPGGTVTTVAGTGKGGYNGDGVAAIQAQLFGPSGVAVDSNGNLFIADRVNYRIRKVSNTGVITTVAGNGTGTFLSDCTSPRFAGPPPAGDGPATSAQLRYPLGVAVDRGGNLYIADAGSHSIHKVSPNGEMTTVAGTGLCGGFSGDGGPAANAQLFSPVAVAVDSAGNLFIAEDGNNRIRRVSADGIITTVAGDGTRGLSGDGGAGTAAHLRLDCDNTICGGVAVDSHGNVFFSDGGNNRIRRISVDGNITTVAGNGSLGFAGDGGQATSTSVTIPRGLAVDSADNLFISEEGRIRKVSPDGTIATVAGGIPFGGVGFSGDGGLATSGRLSWPVGLAVDSAGSLFIADPGFNFETGDAGDDPSVDQRIRKVSPDGMITTLAGTGSHDFAGDGGPAATAAFNGAIGVAVDGAGNIYVADARNSVIRILRPAKSTALIGAVVDAASQHADPVSPGKIVVIYGAGLGPSQLVQTQAKNGLIGTELSGTTVSFNGLAAPILYTSATQVAVVVPYAISGSTARVAVTYQGHVSADFTVQVAAAAPDVFTANQAGWGQAAALNAADGTVNSPANPAKIGEYISLYATGEGQTTPGGADGKLAGSTPSLPSRPVTVMVGGIPATVQYAGGLPGQVAGLMQVNVQIPNGVPPGGYVPVVLQVGDSSTTPGAVWIAVSAN
jgi:uncharacterized protein (TIGR03437 family)